MNMFIDPGSIYLHRAAIDFRKSINGLVTIVEQDMKLSPFADALFVFSNKNRDKLKLVYWDKTGFCLWYKRLEKDKFKWPAQYPNAIMTLSEEQFRWLLSGYDIIGHQPLMYAETA